MLILHSTLRYSIIKDTVLLKNSTWSMDNNADCSHIFFYFLAICDI